MEQRSHVNVPVGCFYHSTSPTVSFSAILKTCANDFMVHEVTLQDNILGLKELSRTMPAVPSDLQDVAAGCPAAAPETPEAFDLTTVFTPAQLTQLEEINCSMKTSSDLHLDVPLKVPKENRRQFYTSLKSSFPLLTTSLLQDTTLHITADTTLAPLQALLPFSDIRLIAAYRHQPTDTSLTVPTPLDRTTRTAVIRILSSLFPFFDFKTIGSDTLKHITIHWKKKSYKTKRKSNEISTNYHISFTLCKTNIEQLAALSLLSKHLCLPSYTIATAGIKDKVALTYQRCSVPTSSASQYHSIAAKLLSFQHHRVSVGDFALDSVPVTLGSLNGNYFRIVLRHIVSTLPFEESVSRLQHRLAAISEIGCPNYFGSQRFGESRSVLTEEKPENDDIAADAVADSDDAHENISCSSSSRCMPLGAVVGKYLILQDYKSAMLAILCPDSTATTTTTTTTEYSDHISRARALIAAYYFGNSSSLPTGDILKLFPLNMTRERCIVKSLHRFGEASAKAADTFRTAIESIPYSARQLYIHAYQSWLWNDVASFAIQGEVSKDLQLPMFGKQSELPQNHIGKYYYDLLVREGMVTATGATSSYTNMMKANLHPGVSLPSGSNRSLLMKPANVSIVGNNEDESIVVSFQLQAGCYATALLRELLRNDCVI